ncbi:PREDICTED: pentatricopeptide repeat-containing protein At2g36730-like [Tarenaya hassleriana]|uniref:pentatricopeptide repeat-containing protein At2g36730-like n=1 Tax=Tarenaya hassleriana TaxID=28532 RepID=UPI00053C352D|nr:PREDICTED: pentatricopeptide repeat-containing protein At2g36730-like [Tarenaya hassleriana]
MVRSSASTANFSTSNFASKKHQCLVFLKLCSSIKHLLQIHAQILISGLQSDTFVLSELVRVSSLSPAKDLAYARTLLFGSLDSTPSTWNMLSRGYSSSDSPVESIRVYCEMKKRGIRPNKLTFPFLLKACASFFGLAAGRQIQVEVLKLGFDSDVYVGNNLIHFYGSCNKTSDARKVFDEMLERNVVSWNSVMTSLVENNKFDFGISYFLEMMDCGFHPDETTMVVMLSACDANLSMGKLVHSQEITRGLELNCRLGTALVDMYAKAGGLDYARSVFVRTDEKNVWTWSAMILGLAQYGFAEEALELFSTMRKETLVKPNYVTFLGVLCACSHAGLVEDGYKYFHEMEHKHKIKPMMVHYGAMVDILGRAGLLNEAYDFIKKMPTEPDAIVWRTLLSSCSIHPDKDGEGISEKVSKRLLELEPKRGGNFVIVANMFAEAGMWDEAAKVRRVMKDEKMKKMAGESCLELGGSVHRFFSGYDPHPAFVCIYELLDLLKIHLTTIDVIL